MTCSWPDSWATHDTVSQEHSRGFNVSQPTPGLLKQFRASVAYTIPILILKWVAIMEIIGYNMIYPPVN